MKKCCLCLLLLALISSSLLAKEKPLARTLNGLSSLLQKAEREKNLALFKENFSPDLWKKEGQKIKALWINHSWRFIKQTVLSKRGVLFVRVHRDEKFLQDLYLLCALQEGRWQVREISSNFDRVLPLLQREAFVDNWGKKKFSLLLQSFTKGLQEGKEPLIRKAFHPYYWIQGEASGWRYFCLSIGKRKVRIFDPTTSGRFGAFGLEISQGKRAYREYHLCKKIKGQWYIVEVTRRETRRTSWIKMDLFDNLVDTFLDKAEKGEGSSIKGWAAFVSQSQGKRLECPHQFYRQKQGYFLVDLFDGGAKTGTFFALAFESGQWKVSDLSQNSSLVSPLRKEEYLLGRWGTKSEMALVTDLERAAQARSLENFRRVFHPSCWIRKGLSGQAFWKRVIKRGFQIQMSPQILYEGKNIHIQGSIPSSPPLKFKVVVKNFGQGKFAIVDVILE